MIASTATQETIRTATQRARRAMELRATVGRGTAHTRARVEDGLTCRVEDGDWHLTADMPEKVGGGGQGPDPGVYARTGLATCLAVGYSLWAAEKGVPLTSLEVEVEADYDARPEFGMGDQPPGYEALRWTVRVESPEPRERVEEVLATAEACSPLLALFREPQRIERSVRINEETED